MKRHCRARNLSRVVRVRGEGSLISGISDTRSMDQSNTRRAWESSGAMPAINNLVVRGLGRQCNACVGDLEQIEPVEPHSCLGTPFLEAGRADVRNCDERCTTSRATLLRPLVAKVSWSPLPLLATLNSSSKAEFHRVHPLRRPLECYLTSVFGLP